MTNINVDNTNNANNKQGNKILKILRSIKFFFANKFRKIKVFFTRKKYIVNDYPKDQLSKSIKKATRAMDVLPEYLGIIPEMKKDNISELVKIDNDYTRGKKAVLGKGVFGEVSLAVLTDAENRDSKKNISPLLVKKKFKDDVKNNITAQYYAKAAQKNNKKVGVLSFLDDDMVVSRYQGETLAELIKSNRTEVGSKNYKPVKLSDSIKRTISLQLLTQIADLHKEGILYMLI